MLIFYNMNVIFDEKTLFFVQSMEISKPTPPFEDHVYDVP